jgi:hypothetical protein
MKRYYAPFLWATLLLLAFCATARSQQFRPMLGPAETDSVKRTALGISYQSNGFDWVHYKRIKKTVEWMQANGDDNPVLDFVEIGNNTDQMPRQIDAIYNGQVAEWAACGGKYRRAAQLDPRRLFITIEATPFYHPYYGPNFPIAGMVDGNKIRVVVAHLNSKSRFLQHYRNLLAWEFGNWFQVQILGAPKRLEDEIGNASPCGRK